MASDPIASPRFAYLLIMAAAVMWLAACSGAAGSGPSATAPNPTVGVALTPAGNNPSSPSGTANTAEVKPKTLTVSDQGQGGITIKGTWVVPGSPEASSSQLDRYLAVKVALDTHSGDLTKFDLTRLSVLRDDKGKDTLPAAWENISNDSHHREGILRFPRGVEEGSQYLELVVRDVGGVKERVLRWELQGQVGGWSRPASRGGWLPL